MKFVAVLVVGTAVINQACAGPIWDRAKKMFGWDKPEDYNQNVAFAPHYHSGGGSHRYTANGPSPKGSHYGPPGPPPPSPPRGPYPPGYDLGPTPYGSRPDLQHASSAPYGSYAAPSYAGPSYAKPPQRPSAYSNGFAGLQGPMTAASPYISNGGSGPFNSLGGDGLPDYGAHFAGNNYGGLFSVVDQTSQIGQLANGDLAASPSEPYASNEDVMKSLLKMVDKPFDLETAASGNHYFSQKPQLAINPGPHPIMEPDRNVIRYRTSPIQIGVADSYSQQHASGRTASGLHSTAPGHQTTFDAAAAYRGTTTYGDSAFSTSARGSSYGGDLHAAASTAHKGSAVSKPTR